VLIVVRHGRTEANASGRLLGRLDLPLDPVGEAQAAALGAAIGTVDRVVSSPLLRTRQTAAHLGATAEGVEIDERLIELDYGDYDGLPLSEVPVELWRRWRTEPDFAPPGGESLSALRARVAAAFDDLLASAMDKTIVVVAHVSPIKAAVAWALGLGAGIGDEVTWRMFVSPASISRIAVTERGPVLHSFNEVAHLEGIGPS
jgi:broad specificity phosphatase PhoE